MLDSMDSLELTTWQVYFREHAKRNEEHAKRAAEDRRLVGGEV